MKRAHLVLALLLPACEPDLGERESRITTPRILGIRGEPAEAKAGEAVAYTLLVASPEGPIVTPLASWAWCATPKSLLENGAVSRACSGSGVRPIAEGPPSVETPIPADACALFGPEVTSADLRPRDADITGGFYQPLRVTLFATGVGVAFGLQRVRCALSGVSAAETGELSTRYVQNVNPVLSFFGGSVAGAPVVLAEIPRGASVDLRVAWERTETYVVFDRSVGRVIERREAMRASWFSTRGDFGTDRTGRDEAELETFTDNTWTAPPEASTSHLFVVLRDARGGVAFGTYMLTTR